MPRFARAILAMLALTACDEGGADDTGSTTGGPDDASFELGQGEFGWAPIDPDGTLNVVLGGQGLLMFPMPARGSGFALPPDPEDWTHPDAPLLDAYVDVDGFTDGRRGHMAFVANYRLPFSLQDDGSYQFNYVALILDDAVLDPQDWDGATGQVHAELRTADRDEALIFDRNVVISTELLP